MHSNRPIDTDIVLLGAGHAHLAVLRRFARKPEPGVRLTLIGREPETLYSGMLPGVIRGDYDPEEAHIDLAPLAAAAQARLILGTAEAIDLEARTVIVPGRPPVSYDLLSINAGGEPADPPEGGIAVRPIGRFLPRLRAIESALDDHARVAVVGGGPAGVELALALAARFNGRYKVALVSGSAEPLEDAPEKARRAAIAALVEAEVEIVRGAMGGAFHDGRLALSDGSFLEAAACLRATGLEAPRFLADSGLACDAQGCVRVERTLRSMNDSNVFAAGDCASVMGVPRPKAGVWAARAGVLLAENLRRAARDRPLRRWRAQVDPLVLLGLGQGRAMGWWHGVTVSGPWVWRLKDRIDRRWMRGFQALPIAVQGEIPGGPSTGARVLAEALSALAVGDSPDLLSGLDPAGGGAVLRVPEDRLLVQSFAQVRGLLDNPWIVGQIAATRALSGLHAMGALPWTAMAVASVPFGPEEKMRAGLTLMLRGAAEVLRAEGCTLIGGRPDETSETTLGFAVSGLAVPGGLMSKAGLKVGDALVLTKPLGTGVVLAGHALGQARARWLAAAVRSMRTSDGPAARTGRAHGMTACTPVEALGLVGHLREMTRASGVAAVLWRDAIPVLPGALDLLAEGVEAAATADNAAAAPWLSDTPEERILADPQTSGGLLIGLPPDRAEAFLAASREIGLTAAVVGVVEAMVADGPDVRVGTKPG